MISDPKKALEQAIESAAPEFHTKSPEEQSQILMRHFSWDRICDRERHWEDPVEFRARQLLSGMKARSKKCGVPFDAETITLCYLVRFLDVHADLSCECCGRHLQFLYRNRLGENRTSDASPTIDRIIPAKGYVPGNIAALCFRCNTLKRDAVAEELERIAAWMRERGCVADQPQSQEEVA